MKKPKDEEIAEMYAAAIKMLHDSQRLNQQTLNAVEAMKMNRHIGFMITVILTLSLIVVGKYLFN